MRRELAALVGTIEKGTYSDVRLMTAARRPLAEAVEWTTGRRRRYLEALLALTDARRESALESLSTGHFLRVGLPRPEHQVAIATPFATYFPDNLWAAWRVIGEADGEGKYSDPQRVTAEKIRDGHLHDAGYNVLHWPGKEMHGTPLRVVDRMGRRLAACGWDGVLQPWTW